MANVQAIFIEPLLAVFDAPQGSDPSGFFAALADDLRYFTADALECGMRNLRRTRKYRTFPSIAECVASCEAAAGQASAPRAPEKPKPWRDPDREAYAARLCRCALGERAERQGWLPGLLEFAYDNERLPEPLEEAGIADKAGAIIAQMEEFSRVPHDKLKGDDIFPAVARTRQAMHDTAARKVFGRQQSVFRVLFGATLTKGAA